MKPFLKKVFPEKILNNYQEFQRRSKAKEIYLKEKEKEEFGDYYSLNAFDYYKCIFVHIPKAAGVSVNKSLFGNLGGGHRSIREYQDIYPKKTFQRYFKFTFVRNPYERVFSAFSFLKKGGFNERDALWSKDYLSKFNNFEAFVKEWVNPENIYRKNHFTPQFEYLISKDGTIPLDFIGKVENMDQDFSFVCNKMNVPYTLQHLNSSFKKTAEECMDDEMKSIIRKAYSKDFELFSY